jgi:hypothetical protein
MHQEHNRSLEVIIESPSHIAGNQQVVIGSGLSAPGGAMLLSSQNGNIKSLQNSMKVKHGNGFSPATRLSNKFGPS